LHFLYLLGKRGSQIMGGKLTSTGRAPLARRALQGAKTSVKV